MSQRRARTAAHPAPRHLQISGRGGDPASTSAVLTSFQKSSWPSPTELHRLPPVGWAPPQSCFIPLVGCSPLRVPLFYPSYEAFFTGGQNLVLEKRISLCRQPIGSIYSNAEGHATIAGSFPKAQRAIGVVIAEPKETRLRTARETAAGP